MSLNDFAVKMIEKYQNNKPPTRPARCIHYPSCSEYSKGCYKKFNFFKASFLTFKRILFCTPLNHKTYDPVPLNKEEKKEDKELWNEANKIEPILLNHYQMYPLSTPQDFIKLIYQNSFGPNHLNIDHDMAIKRITNELKEVERTSEYIEDIGNGYVRYYLYLDMDIQNVVNEFISSCKKRDEKDLRLFYRKISLFNKLVNKGKIKLNKKETSKAVKDYLFSTINPVSHSKIYKDNYHPHYILIKKMEAE